MLIQYNLIQAALTFVALIILGFILEFKTLIMAILIGSLIFILMRITIQMTKRIGSKLAELNENYYNNINHGLKNYKYLKSTKLENVFLNKISPILKKIIDQQIKFTVINWATKLFTDPLVVISIAIVLFISLTYLSVSLASIIVIYVVLARVYVQLISIVGQLQGYYKDLEAYRYCKNLLSDSKNYRENNGRKQFTSLDENICIENVSYSIDKKKILENLTVKIPKNKITLITGASGSGKTTLLNIIIGLIKPTLE